MPFRDKVRKAFRRSSGTKDDGKPKIEYYRRGEVPRSKYRGPVDPEHRRQLYAWNFAAATAERTRSFDLDLSPCTSLPEDAHCSDEEAMDSDPFDGRRQRLHLVGGGEQILSHYCLRETTMLTIILEQTRFRLHTTKWLHLDLSITHHLPPCSTPKVIILRL